MKIATLLRLATALVLACAASLAQANDLRFSSTLAAEDKVAAGITRLTSDEVAVLDALVRRDTATRGNTPAPKSHEEAAPAEFSKRLTEDERRIAGIARLTETELSKLNELVDRHQNAKLARTFLAPPEFLARRHRGAPVEKKDARRVHGSFSLSYGWGSGDYSEKTGSMVVNIDDPERNMSLSIGYSQSHIKGGHGPVYRDPFYDPFYDSDPFYGRGPLYDRDPFYGRGRLHDRDPLLLGPYRRIDGSDVTRP